MSRDDDNGHNDNTNIENTNDNIVNHILMTMTINVNMLMLCHDKPCSICQIQIGTIFYRYRYFSKFPYRYRYQYFQKKHRYFIDISKYADISTVDIDISLKKHEKSPKSAEKNDPFFPKCPYRYRY